MNRASVSAFLLFTSTLALVVSSAKQDDDASETVDIYSKIYNVPNVNGQDTSKEMAIVRSLRDKVPNNEQFQVYIPMKWVEQVGDPNVYTYMVVIAMDLSQCLYVQGSESKGKVELMQSRVDKCDRQLEGYFK